MHLHCVQYAIIVFANEQTCATVFDFLDWRVAIYDSQASIQALQMSAILGFYPVMPVLALENMCAVLCSSCSLQAYRLDHHRYCW